MHCRTCATTIDRVNNAPLCDECYAHAGIVRDLRRQLAEAQELLATRETQLRDAWTTKRDTTLEDLAEQLREILADHKKLAAVERRCEELEAALRPFAEGRVVAPGADPYTDPAVVVSLAELEAARQIMSTTASANGHKVKDSCRRCEELEQDRDRLRKWLAATKRRGGLRIYPQEWNAEWLDAEVAALDRVGESE